MKIRRKGEKIQLKKHQGLLKSEGNFTYYWYKKKQMITYREARLEDIGAIQLVRHSVKENILSNPALVTDADCEAYLLYRGKGWVCEMDGTIVGFSIADLQEENIWALFLKPEVEGLGIGSKLHDLMLDWYFSKGKQEVWLGTSPGTRAESFYLKKGWKAAGKHGEDEIKFTMTRNKWQILRDHQ